MLKFLWSRGAQYLPDTSPLPTRKILLTIHQRLLWATTTPELSPVLGLMLPLQPFSKMVTFATELSGDQRISQKTSP